MTEGENQKEEWKKKKNKPLVEPFQSKFDDGVLYSAEPTFPLYRQLVHTFENDESDMERNPCR